MIDNLRMTVLAENTVRCPSLLAEHGLSFWIEADAHRILFDTGQGMVLRQNAQQLDIPLDEAEIVVISHGHFDHTGGLKDVLDLAQQTKVYLHPAALEEKYHRQRTPPHRAIGTPDIDEQTLHRQVRSITWTRTPTELVGRVHVTGEIPRRNALEDVGGPVGGARWYYDPTARRETSPPVGSKQYRVTWAGRAPMGSPLGTGSRPGTWMETWTRLPPRMGTWLGKELGL